MPRGHGGLTTFRGRNVLPRHPDEHRTTDRATMSPPHREPTDGTVPPPWDVSRADRSTRTPVRRRRRGTDDGRDLPGVPLATRPAPAGGDRCARFAGGTRTPGTGQAVPRRHGGRLSSSWIVRPVPALSGGTVRSVHARPAPAGAGVSSLPALPWNRWRRPGRSVLPSARVRPPQARSRRSAERPAGSTTLRPAAI